MLGQVTIPMMLFSLGVRLSQDRIEHLSFAFKINLQYLCAGALAVVIIIWLLPLTPDWQRLLILAAFLPPAVLNFMLCEHYKKGCFKTAPFLYCVSDLDQRAHWRLWC